MTQSKHILLVESDPVLRRSLAEQLLQAGEYTVAQAGDVETARAAESGYGFLILDDALPGAEDFARGLRDLDYSGLILFLTNAGGDGPAEIGESLARPFRFASLLARLQAETGRLSEAEVMIGPYSFRPAAKLLSEGERRIRLTEKETDILRFLHAAGGNVPRETLLHEVWGYNPAVTTHTLETHIYRLRKKIEANPGEAHILLTEAGGYRLAHPE